MNSHRPAPPFDVAGALCDKAAGAAIATFGLMLAFPGCSRSRPEATPDAVRLFIAAGWRFNSSTAPANPAVTIARTLFAEPAKGG